MSKDTKPPAVTPPEIDGFWRDGTISQVAPKGGILPLDAREELPLEPAIDPNHKPTYAERRARFQRHIKPLPPKQLEIQLPPPPAPLPPSKPREVRIAFRAVGVLGRTVVPPPASPCPEPPLDRGFQSNFVFTRPAPGQ